MEEEDVMAEIFAGIVIGLVVLANALSFFGAKKSRDTLYEKTARDTSFNRPRAHA